MYITLHAVQLPAAKSAKLPGVLLPLVWGALLTQLTGGVSHVHEGGDAFAYQGCGGLLRDWWCDSCRGWSRQLGAGRVTRSGWRGVVGLETADGGGHDLQGRRAADRPHAESRGFAWRAELPDGLRRYPKQCADWHDVVR